MPKLASIFSRAHYNFLLTWAYSLTLFRMQGSMNMQMVNELINSCTCASTHAQTQTPTHSRRPNHLHIILDHDEFNWIVLANYSRCFVGSIKNVCLFPESGEMLNF